MKPRTALAGAAALCLLPAAAGCGTDGPHPGAATARGPIRVWLSTNAQEVAWGRQVVEAWNTAHPGEPVTAQRIPAGQTSEAVISASIIAGNAPCLIYNTSPAAVPQFQAQGGLVALDGFPGGERYVTARSGAPAGQYRSPDGRFYQLPWKSNPVMLFYNRKAFAAAGISTTAPPLGTHTGFLATAEKLVSSGAARYAVLPSPSSQFFQSWFDFYPMYAAETGRPLVAGSKATFDSDAGRAVAGFWRRLYAEHLAGREAYAGDAFADGTAAMASAGPWAVAAYRGRVDWGVTSVPTRAGSAPEQATFSDAKNVTLHTACANRGTAWDFLRFSTSREQDGKLLEMTGQMPLRRDLTREYPAFFTAHPQYRVFAAKVAHVVEVPNVPDSVEVWQAFRDAWTNSVIFGRADPAKALTDASTQIDELLR
ncbi:extracellular solute-binding protein [Actinoplanes teichomyceticus]|uniref:Carbohydrate ABC transporter substrate-binding protein (CUT1 family) n=1 Tax=Actinoplanes teichomyceticus TaxID=1867 RepID=A0A561VCR2_ACTTI|nr:extracellular solute-binding protein [Actinoplanes teichomyceticus]TWG09402.1 carbohydrate ABC transporter substrate-binding protein (CUT1 family) [Actinoplanes teichomyceticus]GIF17015.1 sugar ABC transporter substrate-binding protein [Actinoplanes teichomyceticus]